MKILIVTQYFWPEQFIINSLGAELQKRGHEVSVLTGLPNYPEGQFAKGYSFFKGPFKEVYEGIPIMRVPILARRKGFFNLALNYASFIFSAIVFSFFHRTKNIDLIFCFAPSPAVSCLPAVFLRWLTKKKLVFWVQDLWPESVQAVGAIRSERVTNVVGRIIQFIYKRCDLILVQSKAFIPSILKWGGSQKQIHFVPNWADPFSEKNEIPNWVSDLPEGFLIGFAGNIGQAQDMKTLIAAAEILRNDSDIKWIVAGDGSDKKWLDDEIQKRNLSKNVLTVGRKPYLEMLPFFKKADVMLVSLTNEYIFSLTVPAKIQAYMSAGRPLIASLAGEGAKLVEESQSGVTCAPQTPSALAEAVLKMKNKSASERALMGQNAFQFFQNNFERNLVINRLEDVFKKCVSNEI
jgi:glycosyltransferase involved in cell wall biosynthesis